jgi:hypothetical protein
MFAESSGDIKIRLMKLNIFPGDKDVVVQSYTTVESRGVLSHLYFTIEGFGPTLGAQSPASFSIEEFSIPTTGDSRSYFYQYGTQIQNVSTPINSNSSTWPTTTYSLDLTSIIQSAQKTFLTRSKLNVTSTEVTVAGTLDFSFEVINAVTVQSASQYMFFTFHSAANDSLFDFDVLTPQPVQTAKVGSADMERLAPDHVDYLLSGPTVQSDVYVE